MLLSSTGVSSSTNTLPDLSVNESSYRKILKVGVASILQETGFGKATPLALESLCEIYQSFLSELGRSSRAFSDLACRAHPMHSDVLLALVEMGHPPTGLQEYAFRTGRKSIPNPNTAVPVKSTPILHSGERKRPKTHALPEHAPDLPDAHAYLRTPTHKQPITDYIGVREKAASQKRDVERALTRFIAKTGKTHSLFNTDDTNLFPLIAPDRTMPDQTAVLPAYINALLFKDQIFEEDEREFQPKKRKEEEPEEKDEVKEEDKDEEGGEGGEKKEKAKKEEKSAASGGINNPFLRPVRMPRSMGLKRPL